MTWEILVVFGLIALSIVLFAWERVGFDMAAFIMLSVLLVTGILTPSERIQGLSNAAVVTIGALFILSDALASLLRFRMQLLPLAATVLVAVVVLTVLGVMPVVATATNGALVIVATRGLALEEAYQAINWKVI